MEKYLPSIISLAGVLLTVAASIWLGLAKQRTDNKVAESKVSGDITDDLLALVDKYEKQLELKEEQIRRRDEQLEKRDQQIQAAQTVISSQLEKITDLSLTIKQLQFEVKELREELDKFNRKVYYIRELTKEEPKNES